MPISWRKIIFHQLQTFYQKSTNNNGLDSFDTLKHQMKINPPDFAKQPKPKSRTIKASKQKL